MRTEKPFAVVKWLALESTSLSLVAIWVTVSVTVHHICNQFSVCLLDQKDVGGNRDGWRREGMSLSLKEEGVGW